MNRKFKQLLIYVTLGLTFTYAGLANAHIYTGLMANSSGVLRTAQVLTLICPAGTARVSAQVLDMTTNKGLMSVTVFKDGNAQTVSDSGQGDGIYGPYATLSAGAGTYYLIASQTSAVFGQYRVQHHCESASGAETTVGGATLTQP